MSRLQNPAACKKLILLFSGIEEKSISRLNADEYSKIKVQEWIDQRRTALVSTAIDLHYLEALKQVYGRDRGYSNGYLGTFYRLYL